MVELIFNGKPIGGKKGSRFHDDIITVKYQKRLQWVDLLDKVENEKKSRELRINAEIHQVGKVHNFIVGQNLKAQAFLGKKKRLEEKAKKNENESADDSDSEGSVQNETNLAKVGKGPMIAKKNIFKH